VLTYRATALWIEDRDITAHRPAGTVCAPRNSVPFVTGHSFRRPQRGPMMMMMMMGLSGLLQMDSRFMVLVNHWKDR